MNRFAFSGTLLLCLAAAASARAAIPAGYTGTPFSGTPYPIPGRIDIANYDKGPLNVAFFTTHHGDEVTSAPNYRPDHPQASIYVTSQMSGTQFNDKPDTYTAGPLSGMPYPGGGVQDYYIGAVRPGDWVNITVNVATTGSYAVSSTVASAAGNGLIDIRLFVNDLTRAKALADFVMPATGEYHNWVPFSSETDPDAGGSTVHLDAGVQVLTVQSIYEHWNMDYLQFSLVLPDGGLDNGDASAGAGSGSSSASGASTGASGSGGSGAAGSASGASAGAPSGAAVGSGVATGSTVGSGNTSSGSASTSGSTGSVAGAGGASGAPATGGSSMPSSGTNPASGGSSQGTSSTGGTAPSGGHGSGCTLGNASAPVGGTLGGVVVAGLALLAARGRRKSTRR